MNRAPARTPLLRMNEEQHRQMKRLLRECCNYDGDQCLILDRGDGCVCVQLISYSLICSWFRDGVLPLDRELECSLLQHSNEKRCIVCDKRLLPHTMQETSNTALPARQGSGVAKRRKGSGKGIIILRILGTQNPYKSRDSKCENEKDEVWVIFAEKWLKNA